MEEYKFPEKINKFNITQEQYDELIKKLRTLTFQQQEANDLLEGGITSRNLASFRNTYVINAQDSLDSSYPLYVHFNIISEMIKIVSVKVSFWILNYRAYSKAAASGGGQTSSNGGAQTSSATGSASGGGSTSGATGATTETGDIRNTSVDADATTLDVRPMWSLSGLFYQENVGTTSKSLKKCHHYHYIGGHTHTTPNHTHPTHTHTVADHTHTVADHQHDAVYGIFEENTSPTIKFFVSENEGVSYNDTFFGGYDKDKKDLEITSLLTGAGSKLIKFESDVRARLSIQIEIKLDLRARG